MADTDEDIEFCSDAFVVLGCGVAVDCGRSLAAGATLLRLENNLLTLEDTTSLLVPVCLMSTVCVVSSGSGATAFRLVMNIIFVRAKDLIEGIGEMNGDIQCRLANCRTYLDN